MNSLGYSFVEVRIFPPCEEKFYQLYFNGSPRPFVYSETHLLKCLDAIDSFVSCND